LKIVETYDRYTVLSLWVCIENILIEFANQLFGCLIEFESILSEHRIRYGLYRKKSICYYDLLGNGQSYLDAREKVRIPKMDASNP